MKPQQTWEKEGFLLRPFRPEDAIPWCGIKKVDSLFSRIS